MSSDGESIKSAAYCTLRTMTAQCVVDSEEDNSKAAGYSLCLYSAA